jgi:predicted transcriptional regulator
MATDVIACGEDTKISEILSLMEQHRIHQLPLLSEGDKHHTRGSVKGIVILNKIVVREFDVAQATAKAIAISTGKASPDDSLERCAELILGSNQRALPVQENGELVGIISEQDLMQAVRLDGPAGELAKPIMSVTPKDSLATVKQMMIQKNISRVVAAENGRPLGCIGTMDMLKVLRPGWEDYPAHAGKGSGPVKGVGVELQGSRGRGYIEKMSIDKMDIRSLIHKVPIIKEGEGAQAAVDLLRENEEIFVERLGGQWGIITAKDILGAWVKARENALVMIQGLDRDIDAMDVARIQTKAASIVKHISASAELQPMRIYIKKHHKQGPKTKYSVKIEWPTSFGTFIADKEHGRDDKSYGDLTSIAQRALDDLEKQVRKKQEKWRKPDQTDLSLARAAKEEGIGIRTRKIRKMKR